MSPRKYSLVLAPLSLPAASGSLTCAQLGRGCRWETRAPGPGPTPDRRVSRKRAAFPALHRKPTAHCALFYRYFRCSRLLSFLLLQYFFVRLKHYVFYYSFRLLKFISTIPCGLLCQPWLSWVRKQGEKHGGAHGRPRPTVPPARPGTREEPEPRRGPRDVTGARNKRLLPTAAGTPRAARGRGRTSRLIPEASRGLGRRASRGRHRRETRGPGAAARGGAGRWRSERLAGWRRRPSGPGLFGAGRA